MDKQKLEEARQLAMSMTSHPVAFGTIEHTEMAGEMLADLVKAHDALAREAYTWSKAAETYATQLWHHKPLVQAVRNVLEEGQMYAEDMALLRQALEQVERANG